MHRMRGWQARQCGGSCKSRGVTTPTQLSFSFAELLSIRSTIPPKGEPTPVRCGSEHVRMRCSGGKKSGSPPALRGSIAHPLTRMNEGKTICSVGTRLENANADAGVPLRLDKLTLCFSTTSKVISTFVACWSVYGFATEVGHFLARAAWYSMSAE